jgi:hypothetical protein
MSEREQRKVGDNSTSEVIELETPEILEEEQNLYDQSPLVM